MLIELLSISFLTELSMPIVTGAPLTCHLVEDKTITAVLCKNKKYMNLFSVRVACKNLTCCMRHPSI